MKTIFQNKALTTTARPDSVTAQIEKFATEQKAVWQREQTQLRAEIDFERYKVQGIELEIRASGGDPSKSDKLAHSRRYIERREERIAALDSQIAFVEQRMQERIDRGPEVVADYDESLVSFLNHLVEAKRLYDQLAAKQQAVFDLLFDTMPNGAPRLVGLPNSGPRFGAVKAFEETLGKDYPNKSLLTRLLDEARAAGVEVK